MIATRFRRRLRDFLHFIAIWVAIGASAIIADEPAKSAEAKLPSQQQLTNVKAFRESIEKRLWGDWNITSQQSTDYGTRVEMPERSFFFGPSGTDYRWAYYDQHNMDRHAAMILDMTIDPMRLDLIYRRYDSHSHFDVTPGILKFDGERLIWVTGTSERYTWTGEYKSRPTSFKLAAGKKLQEFVRPSLNDRDKPVDLSPVKLEQKRVSLSSDLDAVRALKVTIAERIHGVWDSYPEISTSQKGFDTYGGLEFTFEPQAIQAVIPYTEVSEPILGVFVDVTAIPIRMDLLTDQHDDPRDKYRNDRTLTFPHAKPGVIKLENDKLTWVFSDKPQPFRTDGKYSNTPKDFDIARKEHATLLELVKKPAKK